MAQAPADLDRFGEAVEHFRQRIPISPEKFKTLDARAKRRAFSVADVAQLDLVTDVWNALDKAIAEGTSFEDFRGTIGESLTAAWGQENPWRLETIFRTNVQMAYGAGRWHQLSDPVIKADRPYWRLSVILDSRTSPICQKLAGTVLPADDDFWDTHAPPLHFNCRTGIIALTEEQAADLGVAAKAPETEAADGFGLTPTMDEWSPDLSQYPAALVKIFQGE